MKKTSTINRVLDCLERHSWTALVGAAIFWAAWIGCVHFANRAIGGHDLAGAAIEWATARN